MVVTPIRSTIRNPHLDNGHPIEEALIDLGMVLIELRLSWDDAT